jgi:hypothetical protein
MSMPGFTAQFALGGTTVGYGVPATTIGGSEGVITPSDERVWQCCGWPWDRDCNSIYCPGGRGLCWCQGNSAKCRCV